MKKLKILASLALSLSVIVPTIAVHADICQSTYENLPLTLVLAVGDRLLVKRDNDYVLNGFIECTYSKGGNQLANYFPYGENLAPVVLEAGSGTLWHNNDKTFNNFSCRVGNGSTPVNPDLCKFSHA